MAFFFPLVLFFFARVCATQPVFVYHYCLYDRGNFTSNSTYKTNLDHASPPLPLPKILAMAFTIFHTVKARIQPMLSDSVEAMWATTNVMEEVLFRQKLGTLLDGLKNNASSGGSLQKYATGDTSALGLCRIFGLLQCTPDLSQLQCEECLVSAFRVIPPCCREGMRVFSPCCNVRYEMSLFFDSPLPLLPPPPLVYTPPTNTTSTEGKKFKIQTVIMIVLPVVALLVLLTIGIYAFLRSRKLRERLESSDGDISSMDLLQYDFKTVKDATDDFSTANKLGQGEFGIVYKGKLLNGQEVAVKRDGLREAQSQAAMAFYVFLAPLPLMAKDNAQQNFISHFCLCNAGNFIVNSTFKTNLEHVYFPPSNG